MKDKYNGTSSEEEEEEEEFIPTRRRSNFRMVTTTTASGNPILALEIDSKLLREIFSGVSLS